MTSSSDGPPRGGMSAYQRWELASLDETKGRAPADRDAPAKAAQELAARVAQAEKEGRDRGYAAGMSAAQVERARLANLLERLDAAAGDHEQRLADEVLDLALLVGRQLVGEALAVRRDLVLPVVSAALQQLPQSSQRVEVILNPADADLVHRFLEAEPAGKRCHIQGNPAVAPGGCRLETEQCDIDATLPSRWRRLLAELGRTDDWIEPT